jgi:hypothetical protein
MFCMILTINNHYLPEQYNEGARTASRIQVEHLLPHQVPRLGTNEDVLPYSPIPLHCVHGQLYFYGITLSMTYIHTCKTT